ncbi:sigma factor-like helix-turn-helix DNA-binding protein [Nonomuraea sp. H19]
MREHAGRLAASLVSLLGDFSAAERDDRLRLIFTCCHPALPRQAQIALTLRVVCGLTTAQIAAAFLTQESTVAQRITRAKRAEARDLVDDAEWLASLLAGLMPGEPEAAGLKDLGDASTAIRSSTPPAPSCCATWAAGRRPGGRTSAPWR